jgi:hypothetical protein
MKADADRRRPGAPSIKVPAPAFASLKGRWREDLEARSARIFATLCAIMPQFADRRFGENAAATFPAPPRT